MKAEVALAEAIRRRLHGWLVDDARGQLGTRNQRNQKSIPFLCLYTGTKIDEPGSHALEKFHTFPRLLWKNKEKPDRSIGLFINIHNFRQDKMEPWSQPWEDEIYRIHLIRVRGQGCVCVCVHWKRGGNCLDWWSVMKETRPVRRINDPHRGLVKAFGSLREA